MFALGIDIGGTNVRLGLVDAEYNLSCFERVSSIEVGSPSELAELINTYSKKYDVEDKIVAACIGFPATVSKDRSTVLNAPNFSGFDGVNVKEALNESIKYPVFVDKDVNLLVLYDLFKNKSEARDIVAAYVGTGIGNAIMIDGKLICGHNGVAGELGHIPFGDTEEICGCGNKGCCEPIVGGKFLAALAEKLGADIAELFVTHGKLDALKQYIDRLARVIATEINIIDPELLILGGGVIGMKDFPKDTLSEAIKKHARKPLPCNNLKIIYSDNTTDCGVIGAGISAWKSIKKVGFEMKKMISPSIMCGKIPNYEKTLKIFKNEGIEYLHVDVMDGEFVPNFQFGIDTIKQLREMSDIPLDIHLMITRPENKLEWFDIKEGEYVSIHYESTAHVQKCISYIRSKGAKPMLAINPSTPISVIEEVIDDLAGILVMTVNPGFAGQKIVPSTVKKVNKLRSWLDENGYQDVMIEVDGNVSFENARLLSEAGANIFVAGTSSVYKKDLELTDAINELRRSIEI